jgi:hypothetical protein
VKLLFRLPQPPPPLSLLQADLPARSPPVPLSFSFSSIAPSSVGEHWPLLLEYLPSPRYPFPCTLPRLSGHHAPFCPRELSLAQARYPEKLPSSTVSPSNVTLTPRARRADLKLGTVSPLHAPAIVRACCRYPRSSPVQLTQQTLLPTRLCWTAPGIPTPRITTI